MSSSLLLKGVSEWLARLVGRVFRIKNIARNFEEYLLEEYEERTQLGWCERSSSALR